MLEVNSPNSMQELAIRLRGEGKLIGLVSTSGALHAGHKSLIEKAKEESDVVVVTSFVNPREFGPNEDYQTYPRTTVEDHTFCTELGVDVLFRPEPSEVYSETDSTFVSEDTISAGMCGISRPNYFKGVCSFSVKLFNLVRPDNLYVGLKDAQKSAIQQRIIDDLKFPIRVVTLPVVRDSDGLAVSARNAYLDEFQRRDALTVYESLQSGNELVKNGHRNVDRIIAEVTHHISQIRRLRIIYVVAVDPDTMKPLKREIVGGRTLLASAVWCDEVRLLDGIILG